MPYVEDAKINFRKSSLKALRNFAIMFGVLILVAFGFVWWMGALGPIRLVEVSEEEAIGRCEASVTRMLGDVQSVELDITRVRQRQSFWNIDGGAVTEDQRGLFWSHRYTCRIETNHDTLGQRVIFHGVAQRIDPPPSN